ncbi:MAG: sugar ABC transporter substrate-binding protein [Anaerolineae bacterium]|nr:sugar ABC transporter substrate-binding protein [Anaerolineae bacterium]
MMYNPGRKSLILLFSLFVALSLVMTGCGGAAAPAPANDKPAEEEAAEAPAPAEEEEPAEEAAAEPVEEEAVEEEAAAEEPAAAEGEASELRIAWWGSQDRHDRTIKVIEMYEEENPNVDITFEFAGWEDYWTKMTTQAAGGNLADVMQQDYARLEEWVSRDLILPLDDYVESGVIDLSGIPDASIDGGRIDGTLYGINLGNNSQMVILDADAFEKAGIDLPDQDWTWEEFEDIALKLHEELDIWGIGLGLTNEQLWKSLYLGHGEWAYADDGTTLGYTDDQIFVDYLSMLLRLQDAGAMLSRQDELAEYFGVGPENDPIVTGKSAMAIYWSNQITAIQNAAGEDRNFVLTHLPRPEGGQPSNYLKPSMFFSITKQGSNPDEAAKFINYFINDVEANEVILAERGVPVSPEIQQALQPLLGKPQQAAFDFVKRVEEDNSPIRPPDPAGHADIVNNVWHPEVIDPVMFGLITPEEAAAVLRDMSTDILSRQP